jgi:3-hydroxybutyryl-CoA dehydrogenase
MLDRRDIVDHGPGPVAVIGAGVMGRGIAYAAATAGAPTTLVDVDAGALDAAMTRIETDLEGGVRRGKVDAAAADVARSVLTVSQDLASACRNAVAVIETVTERLEVKRAVLAEAEESAPTDAILATNTSALPITEIMAGLRDPGRGVGMHFFNPVPKMPLCEIVRGLVTRQHTVDTAALLAEAMGKRTVVVKDLPGFVTSRLNVLLGNEALRMLEEGAASPEDIDVATRLGLNHPMGPLEMGDLVGWDTRLDILEHMERRLGDRFRPTNLHRRLVAAGRLGRKSGTGIYHYDDDHRRTDDRSDLL